MIVEDLPFFEFTFSYKLKLDTKKHRCYYNVVADIRAKNSKEGVIK